MSNAFKAGDKITLTPRESEPLSVLMVELLHHHTKQTEFTLASVGLATHNDLEELLKEPSPEPDAITFKCDDCNEEIEMHYLDVTLVE